MSRKTASSSAMASNELSNVSMVTRPWGIRTAPSTFAACSTIGRSARASKLEFGLVPEVGVDQDVIGVGLGREPLGRGRGTPRARDPTEGEATGQRDQNHQTRVGRPVASKADPGNGARDGEEHSPQWNRCSSLTARMVGSGERRCYHPRPPHRRSRRTGYGLWSTSDSSMASMKAAASMASDPPAVRPGTSPGRAAPFDHPPDKENEDRSQDREHDPTGLQRTLVAVPPEEGPRQEPTDCRSVSVVGGVTRPGAIERRRFSSGASGPFPSSSRPEAPPSRKQPFRSNGGVLAPGASGTGSAALPRGVPCDALNVRDR